MTDRKKAREYFVAPFPQKPTFGNNKQIRLGTSLILLGVLLFAAAIYFTDYPILFLVAFLIILIGIVLFYSPRKNYREALERYNARPSDAEMDTWLIDDFKSIVRTNALQRLDFEDSAVEEYLFVPGPVYTQIGGIPEDAILRHAGGDGTFRYSVWNMVIILLTKHHISTYKCLYDWLGNTVVNEQTNEFLYDRVVGVKTESNPNPRPLVRNEGTLDYLQAFKLLVSHDEPEKVEINFSELNPSRSIVAEADKTMRTIRAILRHKQKQDVPIEIVLPKEEGNEKEDAEESMYDD